MKYAIEIVAGAILYIQSFIKFDSAVQRWYGRCAVTRTARKLHGPTNIFQKQGCLYK
jgi:hypothetical protein